VCADRVVTIVAIVTSLDDEWLGFARDWNTVDEQARLLRLADLLGVGDRAKFGRSVTRDYDSHKDSIPQIDLAVNP
jgi:hypothetical protein